MDSLGRRLNRVSDGTAIAGCPKASEWCVKPYLWFIIVAYGWRQTSRGNEFFLACFAHAFDRNLGLQGIGMRAGGLLEDKLQRSLAAQEFRAPAGCMLGESSFHIGADAGIQPPVTTTDHIKKPGGLFLTHQASPIS